MGITIVALESPQVAALRALVDDPDLESEFGEWRIPGALEDWMRGSFRFRDGTRMACLDGEPAGFCLPFVLRGARESWAWLTLGVAGRFRRRGLGSALLEAVTDRLVRAAHPLPLGEICCSTWSPNPAGAAFAAHHGFAHVRRSWRMERPRGPIPVPVWPDGMTVRVFDESPEAIRDWNAAYNDSFAEHYHYVATTEDHYREIMDDSDYRREGILLAYRTGACVGFARNWINAERGELATLGVVAAARGVGLGRALLRASVAWQEGAGAPSVTLGVDGENEGAIRLYRSEGFVVARTRDAWSRRVVGMPPA